MTSKRWTREQADLFFEKIDLGAKHLLEMLTADNDIMALVAASPYDEDELVALAWECMDDGIHQFMCPTMKEGAEKIFLNTRNDIIEALKNQKRLWEKGT